MTINRILENILVTFNSKLIYSSKSHEKNEYHKLDQVPMK
jgi:hypothetical protein